jgi:hypothetical protein
MVFPHPNFSLIYKREHTQFIHDLLDPTFQNLQISEGMWRACHHILMWDAKTVPRLQLRSALESMHQPVWSHFTLSQDLTATWLLRG